MSDPLFSNSHVEARARVIWGESPAEVQHWLVVEQGLTEAQAEVVIQDIGRERAYEIRRSGLRSLRQGILLFLGGAGIGIVLFLIPAFTLSGNRFAVVLAAGAIILIAFGLYKIGTGTMRALSGRSPGSLTEMD